MDLLKIDRLNGREIMVRREPAGRPVRGNAILRQRYLLFCFGTGQEIYGVALYPAVRLPLVGEGLSHCEAARWYIISLPLPVAADRAMGEFLEPGYDCPIKLFVVNYARAERLPTE